MVKKLCALVVDDVKCAMENGEWSEDWWLIKLN
jgi:hypothetical protein